MALESTYKVVLGSIAFGIFWVMVVFPGNPMLPIGRTAGSLLGAILLIIFQVLTPDEAYASIDLPILCLLFGTMVVSIYLEKAQLFRYLGRLLSWKSFGGRDLLIRVCLISALSSAFLTNDTTCIILTDFVLRLAKQNNLPPLPFLLALASSANIGSSATPIGNPQNLVIAVQSGISFEKFLRGILPAMLVGVVINTAIILLIFWKGLAAGTGDNVVAAAWEAEGDSEFEVMDQSVSPGRITGMVEDIESEVVMPGRSVENREEMASEDCIGEAAEEKWVKSDRRLAQFLKGCTYMATAGMVVALLLGVDMSWTVITTAIVLVVIDFRDAGTCFDKVSYSLLLFLSGMFITVEGFNKTGIPRSIWKKMEHSTRINSTGGVTLLAILILILSNIASNVPTVLLLGGKVANSAASISSPSGEEVNKAWLILAWVSAIAGNLSLLGSAANLIVCEQARRSKENNYNLTFWKHLLFGIPSTFIVTTVGLLLIQS